MHSTTTMLAGTFESQKNLKALLVTIGVHALLLLIFFWIVLVVPTTPPPPLEEGIEVNLGNSDIGFGDIQPLVPGEPAPEAQPETAPPQQQVAQTVTDEPEKETSDRDEAEAPEINKPVKVAPKPKPTPVTNPTVATTKPSTQTVTNPTPAPKKPKAVYGGGTGTGGNNSDTYNNSQNQGIAGGKGDQGKPNGNPNSDNYNGNGGSGNGGVTVLKGNRKILSAPKSFEDELGKATNYALIKVSPDGVGTFVQFVAPSTSPTTPYRNAIIRHLREIKFNKSDQESTVTVKFNFDVN